MSDLDDRLDSYLGIGDQPIEDGDVVDGEFIEHRPPEEIKLDIKDVPSEFDSVDVSSDLIYDYIKSRNTLHTLLERATTALQGAMKVAVETESPRGYEVVKQLIESSKDLSKDIINLHKQCKEIKKIEKTTPNNKGDGESAPADGESGGFNGSTKDLLAFMKKLEKDES